MNNTGSSSLIARPGVGQANIETNFVTVKRNGGPLSQFLPSDTDTTTVNPNPIAKAKITTPAFAAIFTDKKEEDVMSEEDDVNTSAKESDHMPFIKVEDPEVKLILKILIILLLIDISIRKFRKLRKELSLSASLQHQIQRITSHQ